jgi:hypothetical protein
VARWPAAQRERERERERERDRTRGKNVLRTFKAATDYSGYAAGSSEVETKTSPKSGNLVEL